MKRNLHILMLLGFSLVANASAQIKNNKDYIRRTIENIGTAVPSAEFNPSDLSKVPEYLELERDSADIWRTAVDNLPEVAPSRNDQAILFNALQALPPREYLDFLYKALDLYAANHISLGVFTHQVLFPGGKMRFFLSHNYNQPEVATFLSKAEKVLKENGEPLMFNVQEAISGKLKQLNEAVRLKDSELAGDVIPLLHLQDTSQQNPSPAAEALIVPRTLSASEPSQSDTAILNPEAIESTSKPWLWISGILALVALVAGVFLALARKKSDSL